MIPSDVTDPSAQTSRRLRLMAAPPRSQVDSAGMRIRSPARNALVLGIMWLGILSAPAQASELVRIDVPSRFVDSQTVQLSQQPADADRESLHANVLLPDGYDPEKSYPVLYLLHGHGSGFASWARPDLGNIEEVAAGFEGIIVMPEGGTGGWYANWWRGGERGNPAWESYFLRELIRQVNQTFSIRPQRRWHSIAGLSMGGEGAMFFASQRPAYFGSAGSFSGIVSTQRPEWPTLFDTQGERHQDVFGDPAAQRFYWSGHNPAALVENLARTRLFVSVGDGVLGPEDEPLSASALSEFLLRPQSVDFVTAARDTGADVTYTPHQGVHDWPYWRADLANFLAWDPFAKVASRPHEWSFQTVAARSRAWGLGFKFEQAPNEVATFDRSGGSLAGEGSGQMRIGGPRPCRSRLSLPFEIRLSSRCRARLGSAR